MEAERAIRVRVDDLAFATGDAIAWPVTADLRATTPLLLRLATAGGEQLTSQLRVQDPLPIGSAVVTGAGTLAVELLVNAVISSDDEPVSESGVRRALRSALQRSADWQIEHLVCAPFGLGAGNLDLEDSAAIMTEVITGHLAQARFPAIVTIIVETPLEEEVFRSTLARVVS
jgi:O-acetyl-ADP-ribose deacetylase (regulator of RNase III)